MTTEPDELLIVMEYAPGGSLADTLERKGSLLGHSVAVLIAEVADALAIAHGQGLLHLDIKPSNILLDSEGWPVLSDFGHARLTATTGQPTPANAAYFDPALAEGQPPGPPSDIYSLGVVCYQALAGAAPFSGDTPLQILRSARTQPFRSLFEVAPDVSASLAGAVERAMARRPQDRFQTASELSLALRQAIGMPVAGSEGAPTPKSASRARLRVAWAKLAWPARKAPARQPERAPSAPSRRMASWSRRRRPSGMTLALALILAGIMVIGALILPRALSSKSEQEAARRALPSRKAPVSKPDRPTIEPSPTPSPPPEPLRPEGTRIAAPPTDPPPAPRQEDTQAPLAPPERPRTGTASPGPGSAPPTSETVPPVPAEPASPPPPPSPPVLSRPIVFTAESDGDKEIYVANDDGTGLKNLTQNPAADRQPALSPDGGEIAFVSRREGSDDIYIVKTDGSGIRKLTNNPSADTTPAWSPDGSRIAFTSERDGRTEVYVIGTDGSGERRLTQNTGTQPVWSPDGARIAFASIHENANTEIHLIRVDGSAETRITHNPALELEPEWSSNGRLAFITTREGTRPEIYVMNDDGTDQVRVTSGHSPAWSPGGTRLAFCRSGSLYVQEADGSQKRIVDGKKATDADW